MSESRIIMKFESEMDMDKAAQFIQSLLGAGVRIEAEVLGNTIEIRVRG